MNWSSSSASNPLGSADPIAGLIAFVDLLAARVMAGGSGQELLSERGTFTFSETVQHAAQSIGYVMTGYPRLSHPGMRATLGRAVKHLFLRRGAMRHNLSAPVLGAPELDPRMPELEAVAVLRSVVHRFASFEGQLQPHPSYGLCTKEQAASLQTMHLREHLPALAKDPGADPLLCVL